MIDIGYRTSEWYEDQLGITVIHREESSGTTDRSKLLFEKLRDRLPLAEFFRKVDRVHLVYVTEPGWDFLTYIVTTDNRAIVFDGFAWGYAGEGPKGLLWLLNQLGFECPRSPVAKFPTVHKPGAWTVTKRGLVHPA